MKAQLRIGISGWRYEPWRSKFYPPKLPQKAELHYASRQVNSIELNGSFYSLQTPSSYREWYSQTPDDFIFAVKGSRYITHLRRLKDVKIPLANFFASGLLGLENKLGPMLWQFPAFFQWKPERFRSFFELLPRDSEQASALARKHDSRVSRRSILKTKNSFPIRHAIEVRHPSFVCPEFVELLRSFNIALVFADTAGKWPYFEDVTSDFIYLRLHGDKKLYESGYTDEALANWERKIRIWAKGTEPSDAIKASTVRPRLKRRDVFCYFDNDIKVHAPFDAIALAQRLDVSRTDVRIAR